MGYVSPFYPQNKNTTLSVSSYIKNNPYANKKPFRLPKYLNGCKVYVGALYGTNFTRLSGTYSGAKLTEGIIRILSTKALIVFLISFPRY